MTSPRDAGAAAWRSIPVKPDLVAIAPIYLDMLAAWREYPTLISPSTLQRFIHRYESLWLPLVAEWSHSDLEPPLDIQWVWHVHMLHPQHYRDYCRARFGRVLPFRIRVLEADERNARERAKLIWRDKYRSETFDLDLQRLSIGTYHLNGPILEPVIRSAARVMDFTHQVGLSQYRDASFLYSASCRYKQFLYLKRTRPFAKVAPPIDIFLMWRLHVLHPQDYMHDVKPDILTSLSADVDLDGRCLLDYGYNATEWSTLYREQLLVPGSAYRGTPSHTLMGVLPRDSTQMPSVDTCDVTVDDISVSEIWSRDKNLIVVVKLLGKSSFSGSELFRTKTQPHQVVRAPAAQKALVHTAFNSTENRGLEFNLYAIRGTCSCMTSEEDLHSMVFNPRQPFEDGMFTTREDFRWEIPRLSRVDPKITFRCSIKASPPPPHILSLERGPFKPTPASKGLQQFVRDLPRWREGLARQGHGPEGMDFVMATHSLRDRDNRLTLTIEVVKQNELDLGAVLVYHEDRSLLVVGHSVGEETLASPSQLTSACPLNFKPDQDQQAMLLTNHKGEWAICKAQWASENGEGRVYHEIFFCDSRKTIKFEVRDDEMKTIAFENVTIDMPTGRLTLDSRSVVIAENVALAFCVGVLHVQCQMKATIFATSRRNSASNLLSNSQNGSVRSGRSVTESELEASLSKTTSKFTARRRNRKMNRQRKLSASFTFLLATGLQIDVTLYGSTGTLRNESRSSLGNIQLLYSQQKHQETPTDSPRALSDVKNNNITPVSHQRTDIPTVNSDRYRDPIDAYGSNSNPPPSTQNSLFVPKVEEDSDSRTGYMDVRL